MIVVILNKVPNVKMPMYLPVHSGHSINIPSEIREHMGSIRPKYLSTYVHLSKTGYSPGCIIYEKRNERF